MWARIENEEIKEIIDFNPEGKFHPSIVWEEVNDSVEVGMVRENGAWVKVERPVVKSELEQILELLKAQQ